MGNAALKKHCANAEKTGVLNVSKNKLETLPPQIKSLVNVLRNLDISDNRFIVLSPEIGVFLQLRTLNISNNRICELPVEIGQLVKLENLNASHNKLKTLPGSICNLTNLKKVDLSNNELTMFPVKLCGLTHLDLLDLSSNKMTSVPSDVGSLYATELNLNQNQIATMSECIADAPRLKTLRVTENCLSLGEFPVKLLSQSKVSMLAVEGNVFEMKEFMHLPGYNDYMERYTAVKKKLF